MIIRLTVAGRLVAALEFHRDQPDPAPPPREQPGPGQTLRLDNPPTRVGYRAAPRPARAHQEDRHA